MVTCAREHPLSILPSFLGADQHGLHQQVSCTLWLLVGVTKGELWQEISRRKERAKVFIPLSHSEVAHP